MNEMGKNLIIQKRQKKTKQIDKDKYECRVAKSVDNARKLL